MKKFTSVITLLAFLTAMTGCVKTEDGQPSANTEATAAVTEATEAETEAAETTEAATEETTEETTSADATEPEKDETEYFPVDGNTMGLTGLTADRLEDDWFYNGNEKGAKLTIYDTDAVSGKFTSAERSGKTVTGSFALEYSLGDDGETRTYRYNFYDSDGNLWNSFEIPQEEDTDTLRSPKNGTSFKRAGNETEEPTEDTTEEATKEADAEAGEGLSKYVGIWDYNGVGIEITATGSDTCDVKITGSDPSYTWTYPCQYYEAGDSSIEQIFCDGAGTKAYTYYDENGEAQSEIFYTDGTAGFNINDYGYLVMFTDNYDFSADWGFEKIN